MIRFYLVPLVQSDDGHFEPKYLESIIETIPQIGGGRVNIKGIQPQELAPIGETRQFLRDYFLLRIATENDVDFSLLDLQTDVIHLTRQILIDNIDRLQSMGINTTGLTLSTPRKTIERRLLIWLENRDRDIEEALAIPGAIISGD